MAWTLQLCFGLAALLCVFQICESWGKIEIHLLRFQSSCTENGFLKHQCDVYFKFCIDKQRNPDVDRCSYLKKKSGHYHDDNTMEFGDKIQGVDNPLVASASVFQTQGSSDVMFIVEAWDKDSITGDDKIATLGKNLSYVPKPSKSKATWESTYKQSGSNHIWFKYRFYCDPYYYSTKCDVYCRARDDNQGHYTCIEGTGEKKCMRGWTGDNCNTDIDECQLGPCYHNATCTNLPGSYECTCPQGYTGQNCDLVASLCHSTPCKNGGTCTGTMEEYNCTCPFEWKGQNCETQVDFCQSNPCQNNATCYATLGSYTCACARGWTGYHCTTEVNACDSSPCENGGNCTKKPQAEYECTCPAEFEGENCQTVKDPCDPNPCLNSGTCTQLTYDTYNCTCVYGWVGDDCDSFLNVSSSTQQQEKDEDKEGVNVLPIILGIISALVIVVGIIILFYLARRRRQKKALEAGIGEAGLGDVVHVAGNDNLAFGNAMYDQTNRANSALEARGTRPALPLPTPTPTTCYPGDVFNFTKPKVVDNDDGQERGAVGGCNPYQDIDGYQTTGKYMDMEGAVGGGKEKHMESNPSAAALDTRTVAGRNNYDNPREVASNPYADFEDLKRRSIAQRDGSGYANTPDNLEQMEQTEENHYHDLDDLHLDIQTSEPDPDLHLDIQTSDPDPFLSLSPPVLSSTSHYDTPRSLSSDATSAGNGGTPTGNDLLFTGSDPTPRASAVGGGYMHMEGTTAREVQLDSLESTDDEEEGEGINQEDIDKLRQEVLQRSANQSAA